ncbi:hypothetical protein BU14_0414s0017 [Porphyra umbilicalis]|uniref:Uncharacterized protein n=1 Tax=Porphyra umbilicalis TaxID=2786 RepID=A0A1X6NVQ2_PORUM|nr:hypothetical protein BU14_0414s0017 [Porphyra umbilicalis]|eukprot:OSX72691.1 hypothetical protein BU14_0414s0017 [Porphyra umbilicalis]
MPTPQACPQRLCRTLRIGCSSSDSGARVHVPIFLHSDTARCMVALSKVACSSASSAMSSALCINSFISTACSTRKFVRFSRTVTVTLPSSLWSSLTILTSFFRSLVIVRTRASAGRESQLIGVRLRGPAWLPPPSPAVILASGVSTAAPSTPAIPPSSAAVALPPTCTPSARCITGCTLPAAAAPAPATPPTGEQLDGSLSRPVAPAVPLPPASSRGATLPPRVSTVDPGTRSPMLPGARTLPPSSRRRWTPAAGASTPWVAYGMTAGAPSAADDMAKRGGGRGRRGRKVPSRGGAGRGDRDLQAAGGEAGVVRASTRLGRGRA